MEDWRSRDAAWDMTRHALDFFREHLPFDRMRHHDGLKEHRGVRFNVHWYKWTFARPTSSPDSA
jgi:hypothetical protein